MKKQIFFSLIILLALLNTAKGQWSLTGNANTTPGTNYIGTTDNKDVVFKTSSSNERLRIQAATGYIGIGTQTPLAKLHIGKVDWGINYLYRNLILEGNYAGTNVRQQNLMTFGTVGDVSYSANPFNDVANGYKENWHIGVISDLAYYNAARFSFVNGGIEKLTVLSNGNIGIGTITPANKLDVIGGVSIGSGNVNANTTKMFLLNPAGKTWAISSGGNMISETNFTIYNWTDHNSTNEPTPQSYFSITNDGNIGIGVNNPGSKLDVLKSSLINGNEVIANFMRAQTATGGSAIVRLGYHSTCDFEINSGNASSGFRFGDYFDLNIVNNNTGGTYGAINFATNGSARMTVKANGNVLIGKTTQTNLTYKLDVAGKIRANEIVVNSNGADFVFDENYKLRSIAELEDFVAINKHLPEIPTADQMKNDGVNMGELQIKLLQKIEELTLYLMELKKENEEIKMRMDKLEF